MPSKKARRTGLAPEVWQGGYARGGPAASAGTHRHVEGLVFTDAKARDGAAPASDQAAFVRVWRENEQLRQQMERYREIYDELRARHWAQQGAFDRLAAEARVGVQAVALVTRLREAHVAHAETGTCLGCWRQWPCSVVDELRDYDAAVAELNRPGPVF